MEKQDIKNLKFRYLLWLYKTTKEEFDRIERKFTQLEIDREILENVKKAIELPGVENKDKLDEYLKAFKDYIDKKEQDGKALKGNGSVLNPEYYFLTLKLKAIEEIIVKEFGRDKREEIKNLYETEMKKRILESRNTR